VPNPHPPACACLNARVASALTDHQPNTNGQATRLDGAVNAVTVIATGSAVLWAAWLMVRMFRNTVDVPFVDQWWFVRFLRDTDNNGGLTLSSLWVPHNEHRIFFPRLLMFGLAKATGWNIRAETATVQLLLIARVVCVVVAVWVASRKTKRSVWLSLPLVAALLCTRAQAENLMWGWQITLTLCALMTTLCCFLVCRDKTISFVAAIICALIAQFSFASGFVLWPIGLVGLAMQVRLSRKHRILKSAVWIAVGVLATVLGNRNTFRLPATHPLTASRVARYSLMFLGGPFAGDLNAPRVEEHATRWGWIGLTAFIIAVTGALLTKQFQQWLPIILWGATGPITAMVTAYGRTVMVDSLGQALSSRYVTLSAPMWAATAVLLVSSMLHVIKGRVPTVTRLAMATICCVGSWVVVDQSEYWEAWAGVTRVELLRNRAILADPTRLSDANKRRLFLVPEWIDELRPFLVEKHYTVFRNHPNGGTK
jgi:hypothetical protein